MSDLNKKIDAMIQGSDIVLFMKGTKEMPLCGFSSLVVQVLNKFDVSFTDVNILQDEELRQGMKDYSDWPTFPQLYLKGEFVGGCDIVKELYQSGEFETLLRDKKLLP